MNDIYKKQVALLIRIMPSVKWKLQKSQKEQSAKAQGRIGKATCFLISGSTVNF